MLSNIKSFLGLAALVLPTVFAHGNVELVTIGGVEYTGYLPYQDPYSNPKPARIMRSIPSNGPVEDILSTSGGVQCNVGATPAGLVAPAKAGDTVSMKWTEWPDSHKGPVITYMAKAPEGTDLTTWEPGTDAVWFKIDEAGLVNGKWAGTDILTGEKNSVWSFDIPSNLASGQYLIRHEIIALHSAGSYPGAQLYPSCIQVDVTGSGSVSPSGSDLVAFPGAYAAADPGITFGLYNNPTSYTIPGPAIPAAFGGSGPAPEVPAPSSSTIVEVPEPTSEVPETPEPTSEVPEVPEPTSEVPEVPEPTTEVPEVPEPTTEVPEVPVPTSVEVPAPPPASSVVAPPPAPTGGVKDANVCWNDYNKCLAATQPNPDWTGCTATRESCLTNATYNYNMLQRARRSARFGHLLA